MCQRSEKKKEVSKHMQHYLRFNTRATRKVTLPSEHYTTECLHDIVVAFVAYDVIEDQLRTGNVYIISDLELQHRMNTVLAHKSILMLLFKRFGLSTTLGSGPGPPPGGGLDGGPSDGPPSGLPPYGGPSPSGGPLPSPSSWSFFFWGSSPSWWSFPS